jgi:L-asparaginase
MRQTLAALALLLLGAAGVRPWATPHEATAPPDATAPREQAAASGVRSTLPRVRLVATGGTISNRDEGRLTAGELITSTPGLDRYVQPEAEQFSNTTSAALTLDEWLGLARRLQALARRSDLSGIVVSSGTDTLEELAYFLDLTVKTDMPIVIVGSMRNPDAPGYEGSANLLDAFRVAASPDARGSGVLVVLNDEINAARDVTKTDALRTEAFQSRGYGRLGVVDADRVVFYRRPLKRHGSDSEFDVNAIDELPRVDVAMVYQGASGDIIRAMVDKGAKGIVIAAAGAGATSGTQDEGVRYALEKGVAVVIGTRTGSGRIAPRPDGGAGALIAAEDLAPLKARILLMLALTRTSNVREIQRMFTQY